MQKSRRIPEILADPHCSPELRQQLDQVLHIRDFASNNLLLPDNNSYRSYADLGRHYVVWNVVATPEFSLSPLTWCFPVAGCVPYRGYFEEQNALEFAKQLEQDKRDTLVYGVVAYSTLNWFDDPALNTFTGRSETYLAALIFHELAHQLVYVPGEADFNEAFAKTVEAEGVRRWLADNGKPQEIVSYERRLRMEVDFIELAQQYRKHLAELYRSPLNETEKRAKKAIILQNFQASVVDFSKQKNDSKGFDHWLEPTLNNARFASLNTYHDLVPAFRNLLAFYSGDLEKFYAQVAVIAQSPPEERAAVMAYLKQPEELSHLPLIF